MTVLRTSEAVDDFIDGAIAATRDDELTAVGGGTLCDFSGFARAGGFLQIGPDAAGFEDAAGFVELSTARIASAAGIRIVNQESVMEFVH